MMRTALALASVTRGCSGSNTLAFQRVSSAAAPRAAVFAHRVHSSRIVCAALTSKEKKTLRSLANTMQQQKKLNIMQVRLNFSDCPGAPVAFSLPTNGPATYRLGRTASLTACEMHWTRLSRRESS